MARLIRAQTADGGTIIDFLDDVMQDRNEGFKTHHRIAAAKELIVHIIRDEQPTPPLPRRERAGVRVTRPESPRRSEGDSYVVPAQAEGNPDNTIVVPAKAGTQGRGVARPSKAGVHPEPNSPVVPAPTTVVPAKAGTQGRGVSRPSKAGVHPEPNSSVVPAPSCPSFPRKREPRGAGWLDPARLEHILSPTHPSFPPPRPSFPRRREPRGAGWLDPARLEYTLSPTHPSFPPPLPSFPRKREPRGAGCLDPARLEHMLSSTHPSFPRRREPRGAGWLDPARLEYTLSPTHPSFPPPLPSFPRKACPVPDTGREPIPVTLSLAPN